MIGLVGLGTAPLIVAMAAAGFLGGLIMPSRDMLVRAAAPPGAVGRTFGVVTTGFNFAGMLGPLMFGYIMDQGAPRWVFLVSMIFMIDHRAGCLARRPPRRREAPRARRVIGHSRRRLSRSGRLRSRRRGFMLPRNGSGASRWRRTLPQDGLVAIVKRDCPTCVMTAPVLGELARARRADGLYAGRSRLSRRRCRRAIADLDARRLAPAQDRDRADPDPVRGRARGRRAPMAGTAPNGSG